MKSAVAHRQKKKGPKQITASALVALSAPRQGE